MNIDFTTEYAPCIEPLITAVTDEFDTNSLSG
jgi:hypothetical protein